MRTVTVAFPKPEYLGLAGVWRFPSESNPGTWHTTYALLSGEIHCSCPGYTYRERCRHVEYLEVKGPRDVRDFFSND